MFTFWKVALCNNHDDMKETSGDTLNLGDAFAALQLFNRDTGSST